MPPERWAASQPMVKTLTNAHSTSLMKTTPNTPRNMRVRFSQRRRKQSGIAIITVLSVLLLMSVLVLAFFSLAANEYTASKNFDYGVRSRQAADTAISMVIGQLRKATTQRTSADGYFAWASQPGAVTSFKANDLNYREFEDAAHTKYKLYSSDVMEAVGDYNCALDVDPKWPDMLDIFCNLNEPIVKDRSGDPQVFFPIVDPRAFVGTYSESTGIDNRDGPEGFGYTQKNSAGRNIDGITFASNPNDPSARLPMPVRWMYMLEDGTIGTFSKSGRFVRSYGEGEPGAENPLSYRFAFWADDESSKVNINTASEATPWDVPRFAGKEERLLSDRQPVENEFQRFPGHPATTSISTILFPDRTIDKNVLKDVYDMTPKIQYGGTEGGTSAKTGKIDVDDSRLYSSPEEQLYGEITRSASEVNNLFKGGVASRRDLERSKFMMTANSRAPELTLFGTPRMCMWAMPISPTDPFDRVIANCATVGGKQYFYRRSNSTSRHNDVYDAAPNNELIEMYLKNHTDLANPIPGFGGNFSRKYGQGEYEDRMQIATEAIDWIRNVNTSGGTAYSTNSPRGTGQVASMCLCGGSAAHRVRWAAPDAYPKGFGRMYTLSEAAIVFVTTARGNTGDAEQKYGLEAGQQRIQASMVFEIFCPSLGFNGIMPNMALQVVDGKTVRSSRSYVESRTNVPELVIQENIAPKSRIAPQPDPKPYMENTVAKGNISTAMKGRRVWGGTGGIRMCLSDNSSGPGKGVSWTMDVRDPTANQPSPIYPVGHIVLPIATKTMTMEETKVRIILYDDAESRSVGNLIQVFELTFPETKLPVPSYAGAGSDTWEKRIAAGVNKENGEDMLIIGGSQETVRSVSVSHGDFRLVSAKRVVEPIKQGGSTGTVILADIFQPHSGYTDESLTHVHSLTRSDGSPVKGMNAADKVLLLPNVPEDFALDVAVQPGTVGYAEHATKRGYPYLAHLSPVESGDFDNGVSFQPDGAYINRSDDGITNGGYFENIDKITNRNTYSNRTPNRLVYSPGQFGSLSTGVQDGIPWRTLLFRPDPTHFGAAHKSVERVFDPQLKYRYKVADSKDRLDPPDHLLMDLFWMPVVQPYPISEPFSTAGKVNLNYQIAPFDYIKRQSALHAVLKGEKILAIPDTAGAAYKSSTKSLPDYRLNIDANETLKQFENRFKEGEIFRSASQICEMYLVPEGEELGTIGKSSTPTGESVVDYPSMRAFWKKHRLTGDNSKERPYAGIYPRVTTKSNVFKVHMTVESLKKARSTDPEIWDVERDRVTSQWRGSAVIERYIDPDDPSIPDYFTPNFRNEDNLEVFYNYRVLNVKQFSP